MDFAGIIWILHLLFLNSISFYFDRMKSGLLNQEFAMTATFSHVDDIIFNDITFKNQLTYLGLPQMKAYYDITISFRFKTIEMNGKFVFCKNIGWRYINNHSDAQRLYISAKKPFSIFFCKWSSYMSCCCEIWVSKALAVL